jgi:hypothetical protein
MSEDDDSELDQLLARGRLSGRQYDEIERRVLARAAPKSRRWLWAASVPVAALACALVVGLRLSVRAPSERSGEGLPTAVPDEFTARGSSASSSGALPVALVLDVGCAGRPPHVCRIGDTLMFSLNGTHSAGYLLALAERVAEPSARIWYFPASDGSAPRVSARTSTSVLAQGVRLGPPHAVGEYRVMAWLSAEPVDEARALQQFNQIRVSPITLEIVE